MNFSARNTYSFLFVFALLILGASIYLQITKNMEPCPLCVIQRGVFALLGIICLIATIHNPARTGQRIYRGSLMILTLLGTFIAGRQLWIQALPEGTVSCGADLLSLLKTFPLQEILPLLFKGTADCQTKGPHIFFLTISEWSLVCFVFFFIVLILSKFQTSSSSR